MILGATKVWPAAARPVTPGQSVRRTLLLLAVVLLAASATEARPIRTNTPGTGIFIGSGVLTQVVCEQREAEAAELSDCALVADFRYSPATHWVLGVRAPLYVERRLDFGGRELSASGPGDVEASAKWRFFRQVGAWFDRHAAIEFGVKLASGDSEVTTDPSVPLPLAHRLSPGTGSTDVFLDLVYQQGQRRYVWGGDLSYRRNGEGEGGYRFGDVVRLSFDTEYIAFPRVYKTPGNEVFLLLEGAFVHRFDDQLGRRDLATGGNEFLLAPGIQHIANEQMLLSLSVELPVWSDLDRLAPESEWNLLAEIRYAF